MIHCFGKKTTEGKEHNMKTKDNIPVGGQKQESGEVHTILWLVVVLFAIWVMNGGHSYFG